MKTHTPSDHATFAKVNALQLAGYRAAAEDMLRKWKSERRFASIQYQPTPGSEAERELIATYDRPGHNIGD